MLPNQRQRVKFVVALVYQPVLLFRAGFQDYLIYP